MKCSQCGADVKWGERYCTFCGHEMNGIFNIKDETNNEDDFWNKYKSSDDVFEDSNSFVNSDRFNNKINISDVGDNLANEDLANEIISAYKGNDNGIARNIDSVNFNAKPKVSNYINKPINTTGLFIFCIIEMIFIFPIFGFIGLILYMTCLRPFATKGDVEKTKKYKKYIRIVLWLGVVLAVLGTILLFILESYNY